MSEDNDYEIVPSKMNPKFGLVVNSTHKSPDSDSVKGCSDKMADHIKYNRTGFRSILDRISPRKPYYTLDSYHNFHFLRHNICMEILNDENHLGKSLVCKFGRIDSDSLSVLVEDDEYLIGSILILFQMNIMRDLLQFCLDRDVENLVLKIPTDFMEELEVYEELWDSQVPIVGSPEPMVKLFISATSDVLQSWKESIEIVKNEMKMTLWRDQVSNVNIRNYLKFNPCHDLFF